ncbi:hypothetical protein AGABI2DRAFT_195753 [Agaricus bisporus var. bisporus H97]|uniref:hypothetical protein n=1 Tax=Agaricus bisporus var. bisporus (strain H97 / ATCC MYA-4626 / FGSC 10389) TaxID=936046 RepID=UPI00029F56BE|nr:hypothetical protein AGABI2DRAFT_195753 [Agaricus bisporus var. bisporus H97]EKV42407.1 hypothetical protein AGABI2DRAFT_195753 [Agaricus bisporus var. bisporus H97]
MKSPSGWVEVNQNCLTGDAIARAQSLSDYSQLYSLILPPSNLAPTSPQTSYLSHLPPLFPPPPFTPSHPTFLHLMSFAQKESQNLRQSADEELAAIVRAKTAEVLANETNLKAQVERLWLKYRNSLDQIQQDKPQAHQSPNPWSSTTRTNDFRNNVQKAPVSVRDFVPVSVTPPARSAPPQVRQSALSASRTQDSTLHQAMAGKGVRGSGASDSTSTTNTVSSTLVPNSINERDTTSVRQFKRNIDDTINTAASFQYFLLEDEMARRRKGQNQDQKTGAERNEVMGLPSASGPLVNGSTNDPSMDSSNDSDAKEGKGKEKKDSKTKNKHVHFNVEPPVEDGRSSAAKKPAKANKSVSEEMVFRLDDHNEDDEDIYRVKATLPLLEQPVIPPRARRIRPQPAAGLPASFSALRPTSLPAPSHMRGGRTSSNDTYSNKIMLSIPRPSEQVSKAVNGENGQKETNDQDTSGDTSDSSPGPTSESGSDSDDYEFESRYNAQFGIPGSLPVNIVSTVKPREALSLASYQPKSTVEANHQRSAATAEAGRPKQVTSSAIRKAAYAARDRSRSLDPGHLDFVAEEDEEEDDERSDRKFVVQSMESGERARQHALKILQARAELPEEGMWRSLA